jgi:hypothetical protein
MTAPLWIRLIGTPLIAWTALMGVGFWNVAGRWMRRKSSDAHAL